MSEKNTSILLHFFEEPLNYFPAREGVSSAGVIVSVIAFNVYDFKHLSDSRGSHFEVFLDCGC